MRYFDPIMEQAFMTCPTPSDSSGSTFEDYMLVMELLGNDLLELRNSLSPEDFRLAENCFHAINLHLEVLSRYYFESG